MLLLIAKCKSLNTQDKGDHFQLMENSTFLKETAKTFHCVLCCICVNTYYS